MTGIDRPEAHRKRPDRRLLIDFPPARLARMCGILQHFLNLDPAIGGDRIDPAPLDDVGQTIHRHIDRRHRDVTDDPLAIQHHGDVARRRHQSGGRPRIEITDGLFRQSEKARCLERFFLTR
jgi:hypothetical protein